MVAEVDKTLSGLGFDKTDFERPLAELSGGQKNRAMLARAILSSPDVLLLDEPTNHLDFQAVEFLEEYLAKSRRAYLVVTHDRRFLDRVAEEIIDLENGRLSSYSGGYTSYRRQKAERILTATRAFDKQQDFIDKEQEYIRRNIAGAELPPGQGPPHQARAGRAAGEADRGHDGRELPVRRGPHRRPQLPAGATTSTWATLRANRSCGTSASSCFAASAWRSWARTGRGRRRC